MWAALQVGSRVQVEEVVAVGGRAAELVVAVELGGTAASWGDVGVGVGVDEIVVEADDDSARAGRGGWVESGGTAALKSVGGSVGDDLGVGVEGIWTADVVGWVVQVSAAALSVVGVVDDPVNTALRLGRVESDSGAALTVGNVADVIVGLGLVGEDIAAVGILSGLDEVVDVDRAAGLGGWVEGLGWTAALLSIGGRENSAGRYVAADLVG